MDDPKNRLLLADQAGYLRALLPPSGPLLQEMEAVAAEREVPIAVPELGRLLEVLAQAIRPQRILEVGTAIGYGTLCLARGAPAATVVSIERNPDMLAEARRWLERGQVADRVELVEGDALEVLPVLSAPFQLAYVDAEKRHYRRFLDLLLPKLSVGGAVVVDNLLWQGQVAGDAVDETTDAIRAFNGYFMIHPQLRSLLLPLGDGVGLAVKTRPLVTEMGGPF